MENHKKTEFEKVGIKAEFVQLNHSFSRKNVLRGLHFQKKPLEQGKLVSVISGEIMDVAADIRPHSKTFKKSVLVTLSEED